MNDDKKMRVSIGLIVYNGEQFLRNRLDNILSQTFENFELIISDNASTDSTPKIISEYAEKDSRIISHRQQSNIGFRTWGFVLEKAKFQYFIWAAVDDYWSRDFLEKNVKVLETNPNVIGSTGKVERYGPAINEFRSRPEDSLFRKIYKKIRRHFRPFGTYSAYGKWEKKARYYLKHQSAQSIYSVFRTDVLRKSMVSELFYAWDMAVVLNVLRFGDLHVFDDVLWFYFSGGASATKLLDRISKKELTIMEIFSGPTTFVTWCRKNYGFGFLLRNLDIFIWLYLVNVIGISVEIMLKIKNKTKQ